MSLWTNPSYQRSVVQINNVSSDISYYARITLTPMTDVSQKPREVLVFPGMEYSVKFYDISLGKVREITCLVSKIIGHDACIEEPCMVVRYMPNNDKINCNSCNRNCTNKGKTGAIPICNCVLNPPDASKYNEPETIYIPLNNILDIKFNRENISSSCKGETKVMILGISATMVKAIVIHLDFFDDCMEDAVKYVDLAVNNVYNITHLCSKDNTIYELTGKLVSIEEKTNYEECKPGKGFVREHVTFGNNIIHTKSDKNSFMSDPPSKKIELIFDTSKDFSGRYESVMLDSIRDCVLVSEGVDGNPVEDEFCAKCEFKYPGCNPVDCGNYPNTKSFSLQNNYSIDGYNISVNGDNISISNTSKSLDTTITMEELLKFYLGI